MRIFICLDKRFINGSQSRVSGVTEEGHKGRTFELTLADEARKVEIDLVDNKVNN